MITTSSVNAPFNPSKPATRARLINSNGTGADYGPVPDSRKEIVHNLRLYEDIGERDGIYRIFKEVETNK